MRIRNVVLAGIAVGAVLFACSGCYSIEQSAPLDVTRFNVPEGRAIVVKVDPAPLTPWAASQEAWVVNLDGKVLVQPVQTPAGGQNWLGALSTNANAALADMPADAALVGSLIAK